MESLSLLSTSFLSFPSSFSTAVITSVGDAGTNNMDISTNKLDDGSDSVVINDRKRKHDDTNIVSNVIGTSITD